MRKPIRCYNCFKVDFKSTHRHTGAIRNIEMNLYIGENCFLSVTVLSISLKIRGVSCCFNMLKDCCLSSASQFYYLYYLFLRKLFSFHTNKGKMGHL